MREQGPHKMSRLEIRPRGAPSDWCGQALNNEKLVGEVSDVKSGQVRVGVVVEGVGGGIGEKVGKKLADLHNPAVPAVILPCEAH